MLIGNGIFIMDSTFRGNLNLCKRVSRFEGILSPTLFSLPCRSFKVAEFPISPHWLMDIGFEKHFVFKCHGP